MNALRSPSLIGDRVARRIFESRGNHSEAHLSELELAQIVAAGVDLSGAAELREALRDTLRAFRTCIGADAFRDFVIGNPTIAAAVKLVPGAL